MSKPTSQIVYLDVALGEAQLREDRLEEKKVEMRLEQFVRVGQLRGRADEHEARVDHPVGAVFPSRP